MVGVINLGSTAQTVTITFNPESGGKSVTVQRSLAPKGALRETLQDLFGFSTDFQNGWVQVSAQFAITGFITYANMTTGAMAAVPVPTQPQTKMLLDQIAGGTWYTGIALLNTSTTDANVEVFMHERAAKLHTDELHCLGEIGHVLREEVALSHAVGAGALLNL